MTENPSPASYSMSYPGVRRALSFGILHQLTPRVYDVVSIMLSREALDRQATQRFPNKQLSRKDGVVGGATDGRQTDW